MSAATPFIRRGPLLAGLLLAGGAAADLTLTPICVEGQYDPTGHQVDRLLDGPRINSTGRVIFSYSYRDITGQSLGAWNDGMQAVLVPFAMMAPDLPPTIPPRPYFNTFGTAVQGDDGSYIFFSGIDGTDIDDSNDTGLWAAASDGQLQLVAWEGDQAGGLPGGLTYTRLVDAYPAINDSGTAAFCAAGKNPNDGKLTYALWQWDGAATHLVAAGGQPAPGTDAAFSYFFNCTLDASGRVIFIGGTTKDGKQHDGLWIGDPSGVTALGVHGQPIPDGSAIFDQFSYTLGPPQVNGAGQVAQECSLAGEGVKFPNNMGVYLFDGQTIVQIARGTDPAPGFEDGTYLFEPGAVAIGNDGACVINARTRTPLGVDKSGIWLARDGGLTLVAREGDPAPGAAPGWVFGDFRNDITGTMDAHGRFYFNQYITNQEQIKVGVWAWDAAGGVRPVVLPRDTVEVDGKVRTIDIATIPSLYRNRGSASVNDSGQVVVYALLENDIRAAILADLNLPACGPDCDENGVLNLFDFLCFVNAFNALGLYADCTGDGALDLFDFLCFVNDFNAGC